MNVGAKRNDFFVVLVSFRDEVALYAVKLLSTIFILPSAVDSNVGFVSA